MIQNLFYINGKERCVYKNLIEECYQVEDIKLGELLKYIDGNTTLILLSVMAWKQTLSLLQRNAAHTTTHPQELL